jgi:hypothetical protein
MNYLDRLISITPALVGRSWNLSRGSLEVPAERGRDEFVLILEPKSPAIRGETRGKPRISYSTSQLAILQVEQ